MFFVTGQTRTRWIRSSPSPEPAVLVLVEEVVVLVLVVEGCDEHNDFTPPETFYVTGALCRFERFIPANAVMTVGKRLRPEVFGG